jgi:hypothetical protein
VGAALGGLSGPAELFSEVPGRFVVSVPDGDRLAVLVERAAAGGVACEVLGRVGGDRLVLAGPGDTALLDLGVAELGARWRSALPEALGEAG